MLSGAWSALQCTSGAQSQLSSKIGATRFERERGRECDMSSEHEEMYSCRKEEVTDLEAIKGPIG